MIVALYQYSKTGRNRLIVSSVEDVKEDVPKHFSFLVAYFHLIIGVVSEIGVLLRMIPFQHA